MLSHLFSYERLAFLFYEEVFAMALYECLFSAGGRIVDWENIECQTLAQLSSTLRKLAAEEGYERAEAWYRDALILELSALDQESRPRLRLVSV